MISGWATRITEALCASGTIEECDRDLYQYGFFLLLSRVIFFLFAVFCGVLFGIPGESIMFFIMFSFLRNYAGGIHAKTESICVILTSGAIFLSVAGIYLMKATSNASITIGMFVVGVTSILIIGPIGSQEKPLTRDELRCHRRYTMMAIFAMLVFSWIGVFLKLQSVLYCAAFSVSLEAIALIIGIVKNRKS